MKQFVICCLVLVVITVQSAFSQAILLRDVNGVPWKTEKYVDIGGSPYLLEEWSNGYILLKKSVNKITGVKLKFDTYQNNLIALVEQTPIVVSNVREFGWLTASGDTAKFQPVVGMKGIKDGTFLQLLFSGKNTLYKSISTAVNSVSVGYSDARKVQSFEQTERLIIKNVDGVFELITKKDLKNALKAYGSGLDELLSKHNASLKKEKTIISLLQDIEGK